MSGGNAEQDGDRGVVFRDSHGNVVDPEDYDHYAARDERHVNSTGRRGQRSSWDDDHHQDQHRGRSPGHNREDRGSKDIKDINEDGGTFDPRSPGPILVQALHRGNGVPSIMTTHEESSRTGTDRRDWVSCTLCGSLHDPEIILPNGNKRRNVSCVNCFRTFQQERARTQAALNRLSVDELLAMIQAPSKIPEPGNFIEWVAAHVDLPRFEQEAEAARAQHALMEREHVTSALQKFNLLDEEGRVHNSDKARTVQAKLREIPMVKAAYVHMRKTAGRLPVAKEFVRRNPELSAFFGTAGPLNQHEVPGVPQESASHSPAQIDGTVVTGEEEPAAAVVADDSAGEAAAPVTPGRRNRKETATPAS